MARKSKLTDEQIKEVIRLRDSGHTWKDIVEHFAGAHEITLTAGRFCQIYGKAKLGELAGVSPKEDTRSDPSIPF